MNISVLRLGHRVYRDRRITTHCCLVARAFGAHNIFIEGDTDRSIVTSVEKVTNLWGGTFSVEFVPNWKKIIKEWTGLIVHLTQYGIAFQEAIDEIKSTKKDILIVVGGKKVPSEVYDLATYNVSVYNQPHSEISALALLLDRLIGPIPSDHFLNPKLSIVPQKHGKKVIQHNKEDI